MEPSTSIVHIDNEIKFKKADVEALKDFENFDSQYYRVCSISNVQYYISVYSCSRGADVYIRMWVKTGNASIISFDGEYSTVAANFSKCVKWEYTNENERNDSCEYVTRTEFNTAKDKIYINDQIIVKIKGNFKITLPVKVRYPISAQWKIKEADLEAIKTSTYDFLESKQFKVSSDSGIKYFLKIYPNGYGEGNQGKVRISLNQCCGRIIRTIFNFSIDSANFSYNSEYVGFGWCTTVCSTEELFNPDRRFFVDGEMVINVTGLLLGESETEAKNLNYENESTASKKYQRYRHEDFCITVGEMNIMVHKELLENVSPYFIGMFNSGMIETTEKKMTITDFDFEVVDAAVDILYYGTPFSKTLTFEQMLSLLQFSDKYDIQPIKDRVQNYLIENLSPMNVCSIYNFIKTAVDAPILYKKCMDFLVKCMEEKKAVHGLDTLDKDVMLKILMAVSAQSL